jgi:hypothetical protein
LIKIFLPRASQETEKRKNLFSGDGFACVTNIPRPHANFSFLSFFLHFGKGEKKRRNGFLAIITIITLGISQTLRTVPEKARRADILSHTPREKHPLEAEIKHNKKEESIFSLATKVIGTFTVCYFVLFCACFRNSFLIGHFFCCFYLHRDTQRRRSQKYFRVFFLF